MTSEPNQGTRLYDRITRLRWQAAVLALVLVFAHQWVEHAYLFFLPRWTHFWTQVTFYGLVGPILAWLALTSLRRQVQETEMAEQSLRVSMDKLAEVNERLEFLISVERRLAEIREEEALLELIMELPNEVVPTLGCSLLRFDERGRPLSPIHKGMLPPDEFAAWAAHLAGFEPAHACASCKARVADASSPCPILTISPAELEAKRVFCLPLKRGGREFAVLNIYLESEDHPTAEERGLLQVMGDGMSMALESQVLRSKELEALAKLHRLQRQESLSDQLGAMLESALSALDVQGGAVCLHVGEPGETNVAARAGDPGPLTDDLLLGFAGSVRQSNRPLHAREVVLGTEARLADLGLVASPLRREGQWLGSLVFWTLASPSVSQHQLKVVEVLAFQASLMVENHRLYREVEYRAGSAERARLAREIHDGLAQTLGYLKLRATQILRWIESGREEEVASGIKEVHRLLDEAYVDAREAIDGLRIDPSSGDLRSWLDQCYEEFRQLSDMRISASTVPPVELRPETQAQILRIVQEALGNVRKHSAATMATVDWVVDRDWLVFTIADDGVGFDPSDVPPISRHGLRIMRERAELLGADFQIRSLSGEGTEVIVRMPLKELRPSGFHD